jgi:glutamine synthetase
MNEAERRKYNIDTLPGSLENAIREFEKSELMKKTLGEHIFNQLIENKKVEWDRYRITITGYELENYLPIL